MLFLAALAYSDTASAGQDDTNRDEVSASCYPENIQPFLTATRNLSYASEGLSKYIAVNNACRDIENNQNFLTSNAVYGALQKAIDVVKNDIPTAIFSTLLGGDKNLKLFKAELDKIAKFKDPYERIRKVYELVSTNQGEYDDNQISRAHQGIDYGRRIYLVNTPNAVLNISKKTGIGGVCRDFANLLYWSLNQVNISDGRRSRSVMGGLDESSFSVRKVFSSDHEWIQVLIPNKQKGSLEFDTIDLDTTYYRHYTPLHPRIPNLSNQDRASLLETCRAVSQCLSRIPLVNPGAFNSRTTLKANKNAVTPHETSSPPNLQINGAGIAK